MVIPLRRSASVACLLLLAVFAVAVTPSVAITPSTGTTSSSPLTFTITFSEAVQGLTAPELSVTGGTVSSLQQVTAGAFSVQWVATVLPSAQGTITLTVPAGMAQNATFEGNSLSNTASVTYDTPPVLTITVPSATISSVTFHIAFDQDWSIADATGLTVTGGAITGQTTVAGTPAAYEVTVTPYGNGLITLNVAQRTFIDTGASLLPNAAISGSVTFGPGTTGSEARVTALQFTSATDRSYSTGETVGFTATFSRPVTQVHGTPVIALNSTGSATVAARGVYQATAGNVLSFTYTVIAGNYIPALDAANTAAFAVGANGGLVGDDGYLAITTLPTPGGAGSLRASGAVGVNYTPPKPPVDSVAGPDTTDSCGIGSGIALVALTAGLGLVALRRRG